jgi:hypothetical protein
VVASGYGYANRMRGALSLPVRDHPYVVLSRTQSLELLGHMLRFTAETLEGRWHYTDDQILAIHMTSRWGPENLEQLLEHAIVHILRHRRQIERFLARESPIGEDART